MNVNKSPLILPWVPRGPVCSAGLRSCSRAAQLAPFVLSPLPSPPCVSQAPHSLSRAVLSSADGWNLPGESQSFSTEFPSKCVFQTCDPAVTAPCPQQAQRTYLHRRVLRAPCSSAGTVHVPKQGDATGTASLCDRPGHDTSLGMSLHSPQGALPAQLPRPGMPSSDHSLFSPAAQRLGLGAGVFLPVSLHPERHPCDWRVLLQL